MRLYGSWHAMFKKLADLFGYVLINKRKSPTLISHLALVLKQQNIDLVVDAGANEGQFGSLLRQIGYEGDILSFEPVSSTFELLAKNSQTDKKWEVVKLALSDQKGTLVINTFKSSTFSSILNPNTFGPERFAGMQTAQQETIDADTLDNVLQIKNLLGKKILLKMDTQGYDLNVFKGAAGSLNNVQALLSEVSFQPIYENMPDYHQVLQVYEKSGFSVTGLYPVSKNSDLSIIEMDCVLVKSHSQKC